MAFAEADRVVRARKGRPVVVKCAAGLLDGPLDLWWRTFEAFPELGVKACAPASSRDGASLLGLMLPEVRLDLLLTLYPAGAIPVPLESVAESLREARSARFGSGESLGGAGETEWQRDLAAVLAALETLGAVERTPCTDPGERAEIVDLFGGNSDLTLVRLTPLGLWGAQKVLRAEGFDAPPAR